MEKDDQQPKTEPAGNKPPPRPPRGTAVGLSPEGGDPNKRRATITKAATGEGKFIRQSGGRGRYGHVIVRIEPNGKGKGIEITTEDAGAIPAQYIKPAIKGVFEALEGGIAIGQPSADVRIVDVVVRIVDGSFHETDSSDLPFIMAAFFAIKDAVKKAEPFVIE